MKIKLEKLLAWEHDLPEPNTWRNNCTSHIHFYFPQQILYLPCCSLRSELLSEKGSIIHLLGCSFVKLITRTNFDPIELYLTILVLFIFLLVNEKVSYHSYLHTSNLFPYFRPYSLNFPWIYLFTEIEIEKFVSEIKNTSNDTLTLSASCLKVSKNWPHRLAELWYSSQLD